MLDITYFASEEIDRLNMRLAEVAADYNRSDLKRRLSIRAGDIRRAREEQRRMHLLNKELAYLACQLKQSEAAQFPFGY